MTDWLRNDKSTAGYGHPPDVPVDCVVPCSDPIGWVLIEHEVIYEEPKGQAVLRDLK